MDFDITPSLNSNADEPKGDHLHALSLAKTRVLEIAIRDAPLSETLDAIAREVEAFSHTGVLTSILLVDEAGRHLGH